MAKKFDPETQTPGFDLIRFTEAQQNIYPAIITELKNGCKQTHWMWFVFPQADGLGNSPAAKRYAIKSIAEARAYMNHPVLGERLLECSTILVDIPGKTADDIFGYPDYLKLQSCMTLFSIAVPQETVFDKVLAKYYKNEKDKRTIEILNRDGL